MSTHRGGTDGLLDLMIGLAIVAALIFVLVLMTGCTATGYDRQAAQMAAAKGCYCAAEKCDRVISAVGVAATVAAEHEAAKQIEVRR